MSMGYPWDILEMPTPGQGYPREDVLYDDAWDILEISIHGISVARNAIMHSAKLEDILQPSHLNKRHTSIYITLMSFSPPRCYLSACICRMTETHWMDFTILTMVQSLCLRTIFFISFICWWIMYWTKTFISQPTPFISPLRYLLNLFFYQEAVVQDTIYAEHPR